ncbi:MAG: phosphate acyltransferase PlsX [Candidatus Omnitrophica bacterium]|nr:phosphate acyltransferase PlsX [Candidatus Omnitrophota bacterium]
MSNDKNIRIVIDAMGGDHAPKEIIEGVVLASKEFDYHLILVGDEVKMNEFLKASDYDHEKISLVHAPESVDMDEAAAVSVRKKKKSSIAVGLKLIEEKQGDVFISAGNTGAVVAASTLYLRTLPFVERPGIGIVFPTLLEPMMLIDAGANIHPKPEHLFHYAVMGSDFMKYVYGQSNPKVGLLNIGEEETKGTDFHKETYAMLENSNLNFIGNIEATDIVMGKTQVLVCDGLIGNTVLKVIEGFAKGAAELLKRELKKSLLCKIGAILSIPAYRAIGKKIDYREYGGAPLLGVNGAVIISHGSSNAKAIKSAVRAAGEYVKKQVNRHIIEDLKKNNRNGNIES